MPVSKKQQLIKEAVALGIPATNRWTVRELEIRINSIKDKTLTPAPLEPVKLSCKSNNPSDQNIPKTTFADILKANQSNEDTSPHVMVTARAGTGKTTTLIKGAGLLVDIPPGITPSPQQQAVWDAILMSKGKAKTVCFATLTNTIADELKRRVPPGMHAYTFHQIGYRAIRERFKLLPGDKAINKFRVDKILEELYGKSIWDLRREKGDVIKLVKELVSLCKMNLVGLGDEDWEHAITELAAQYEITIIPSLFQEICRLVPQVLHRCMEVDKDQCIDFNDMVWLPIALGLQVYKYDLLFVDEAQDLNRCQQELALKAGKRLILCGDPRQAIYGFAGADAESMPRMLKQLSHKEIVQFTDPLEPFGPARYREEGRGCLDLRLTVTRRCGKAIVTEANKIEPDFEAHDSTPEGKVSYARYTLQRTMAGDIELPIEETYLSTVKEGDMVLCMINAPLVQQCFKMIKLGMRASIRGRKIGDNLVQLVESLKPDSVSDLITKMSTWRDNELAKLQAEKFPSETKIGALNDRCDTIQVFTQMISSQSIAELIEKIKSYFTDEQRPGVYLSSGHKAKGLECKRVFFLDIWKISKKKKLADWELEQMSNLRYVMVTRAIEELIYVT